MWHCVSAGRYVIFFMALFSLFTGLIYNEAFSIPLAVFGGSHYKCPGDSSVSLINMRTNEVRPGNLRPGMLGARQQPGSSAY